ncbi:MAG: arsenite methyltransferase [Marinilabiliaceae bacterium]|nr:arsenite methyltransferase [Marinilabiliaceae bacterium]
MKAEDLKLLVQDKYGQIANQSKQENQSSCCGSTGCCDTIDYSIMAESYEKLDGYNNAADLGLGCGLPTQFAGIKKGDHVLDLGSGAGNDCFVARSQVGDEGQVTGLDFTEAMLAKARQNAEKLCFNNVEFVKGDIEAIPLPDATYDVIISNCVLNLVPNKVKAFTQMHRVLKETGHFCVSDIVLEGELPEALQQAAEMYAGCVSGAIPKEEYLDGIKKAGFQSVEIKKEKVINIPDEILVKYMQQDNIQQFKQSGTGIFSITVVGHKQLNLKIY